ncbi:NHLP bacteriocin export ABC transporter permease/ATPase subunit [Azospirillum sp.]|uniref:NHLP bacteriocin export ABC transporter permease/ATPase subunit n=1 Tax=Azospirillum sp. TaxID=34012 RepID=UPI002D2704F1|nr:NHLP bacteriocin export ABC transporter permease/ATPase subunit [Azospirillum sp.]HYD64018.1 NHLP bacteriocin export ABC transporter permease/ATPase subunit [Azospirillum sp.]
MPDAPLSEAIPTLEALARRHGAVRVLAGNAPLLLDDPGRVHVILHGEVDLFLVETRDGAPAGPRRYLFTLRGGDLLFGFDAGTALFPVGVLAVGSVGTRAAGLDLSVLRTAAAGLEDADPLAPRLDRWVAGLSRALAAPIVPRPHLDAALAAGETRTLRGDVRLGSQHEVVWPDLGAGGPVPLFLDTEEVWEAADGVMPPLTKATWVALPGDPAPDKRMVTARTTAEALAAGACWPALAALHRLALDVAPTNLRLAAVDEANRLRRRDEVDAQAGRAAFGHLAAGLAGEPASGALPVIDSTDPLVLAVAAVVRPLGLTLRPPPRERDGERPATLPAIEAANRLRARRVVLEPGWWRDDVGPFLLRRAPDGHTPNGRPLAVLPRGLRGGYDLYDPAEGRVRPLSAAEVAGLRGEAFVFTVPFPATPLRARDIARQALRWNLGDVLMVLVLGLAGAVLNMGVPIATGFLVDSAIPDHDLPKLLEMSAVLAIAALAMLVTRLAGQIASARIEGRSGSRIQAATMDRLLRLPIGFFKNHVAGDLARRALSIRAIEQALSASLVASLLNGVFALGSLVLMAWYSWTLALAGFGLILLMAAAVAWLGLERARRESAALKTTGEAAGLLFQLCNGIAKLRLAMAEDRAFLLWSRRHGAAGRQVFEAGKVTDLTQVVATVFGPVATGALFAVIHQTGLAEGGMALGTLLAFLTAFAQAVAGVTGLAAAAVQMAALKPLYRYAAPILESEPEVDGQTLDPGPLSGAIEIDHVSFRYGEQGPLVLSGLSLSVEPGECVALVGPSGCGKSTILRLLLGFERPEAGAVLFDGFDLAGLDVQAVRRQFGVVLQNDRLMPGSLLDNILGPHLHLGEPDAWAAARQVGLAEDLRAMPMGLHTVVADSGGTLSGGQVQRVLIARAIVAPPRFLLFDEATSALDNLTQAMVTESLDRLTATRLIIAHRLSTVRNADRILVLDGGRIVESGRYDDLMAAGGVFHAMAERQLV